MWNKFKEQVSEALYVIMGLSVVLCLFNPILSIGMILLCAVLLNMFSDDEPTLKDSVYNTDGTLKEGQQHYCDKVTK